MNLYSDAIQRAEEYASRHNLSIVGQLGGGIQGIVFSTNFDTAIKALVRDECYVRERNVYRRLIERNVGNVGRFWVPRLHDASDELLVIEMEVVKPPFVLDFASAYLDELAPYAMDKEIMAGWESEKREQFEGRWPEVKRIMAEFRTHGIHLADVKLGNIVFE